MNNFYLHGNAPYGAAVLHGGPGALGGMSHVAQKLSQICGIIEPIQRALTIDGLVNEFHDTIKQHGNPPMTLIGHSWGAWLSIIYAATYPELIKEIVLIGAGPFEEKYAVLLMDTRLGKLNHNDTSRCMEIQKLLNDPVREDKNQLMAEFGYLMQKADTYLNIDNMPEEKTQISFQAFNCIWSEASALRKNGKLLEYAAAIQCPVTAIHGDYDSHPADGVKIPLSKIIKDFKFIFLKNCGHYPWFEAEAHEKFFSILNKILENNSS